ncbi:MAG: cation-translocating P-type ATPase, partial [Deltaproteobacteria bacterium]|nr:cation-translocating P-type ATPase [Deltaproteobacteria bacterium]
MSFSDTGLSSEDVRRRIEAGQVNRTDRFATRTVSAIIRNNILTLFAAILTAAVGALLLIGAYDDAVVLGAVTAANILAGIIGELRAKR